MSRGKTLILSLLVFGLALPPDAEAWSLGAGAGRAAMRRILRQDWLRDSGTAARALSRPRTVHRYLSRERAALEAREGIAPGRHMTATARPGRPLSAENAQRRYGLPETPEVRQTLRLPAGFPARSNKALGGAPGYGEITSPRALPPAAIRRNVPLR